MKARQKPISRFRILWPDWVLQLCPDIQQRWACLVSWMKSSVSTGTESHPRTIQGTECTWGQCAWSLSHSSPRHCSPSVILLTVQTGAGWSQWSAQLIYEEGIYLVVGRGFYIIHKVSDRRLLRRCFGPGQLWFPIYSIPTLRNHELGVSQWVYSCDPFSLSSQPFMHTCSSMERWIC